jgi:hypothetical protein
MNFRTPGTWALAGLGAVLLLLPRGSMVGPVLWFGPPHFFMTIAMAAVVFCAVYFGTLKFWELITGDRLQKPFPAILALWLGVRLTVDCARMLRWW